MSGTKRGWGAADPPRSTALLVDAVADPSVLAELGRRLAEALPEQWQVVTAVPDTGDGIAGAVKLILAQGCQELVVVPAQPQFSPSATGRVLRALYRALLQYEGALDLAVHATWHDDAGYVSALARRIAEYASAHGLRPAVTYLSFVGSCSSPPAEDDPYGREIHRTAALVAERVGWPSARVTVANRDQALAVEHTLMCPLGPVGPRGQVPPVGSHVCPPLVSFPPFIAALKSIVLKGPEPVPSGREAPTPLLRPTASRRRAAEEPMSLVSVGVSLDGGLGKGRGPRLLPSEPGAFAQVKKSHAGLRDFLDWAREATALREALVWNTCQRMEFYGWLPEGEEISERARLVTRIRRRLLGTEPPGLEVNILHGVDARHHLLRTACGLNSDLPGDRDVVEQLQTACRRAQGAGTAGTLSWALVSEAAALAEDVMARTDFGRFATGYCAAALARIREASPRDLGVLRHVVIGGSTTSRALLCALRSEHGVPDQQLTSVYRDHHGQIKQLRAAVGSGRRLRVHAYSEECVLRTVADADFVFFGIDQVEPVIDVGALEGLRDYGRRPLRVVDFNTFGSLTATPADPGISLWTARDADHEVAIHAAITSSREGFFDAVQEAERWIERHVAGTGASAAGRSRTGRPAPV